MSTDVTCNDLSVLVLQTKRKFVFILQRHPAAMNYDVKNRQFIKHKSAFRQTDCSRRNRGRQELKQGPNKRRIFIKDCDV